MLVPADLRLPAFALGGLAVKSLPVLRVRLQAGRGKARLHHWTFASGVPNGLNHRR
jgi:hypothetical protein